MDDDVALYLAKAADPARIYPLARVDIEDTDEVYEAVVHRLIDMQVHEDLPIYVVPLRPIERVMAELRQQQARGLSPLLPTG